MTSSSVNMINAQNVQTVNSLPSVNNSVNTVTTNTIINNDNSHMKNKPLYMGVIIPPDAHYKPILYSDYRATTEFNQLNQDIYTSAQKSKNIREKKTPLSIKILAGVAAIVTAIMIFKK